MAQSKIKIKINRGQSHRLPRIFWNCCQLLLPPPPVPLLLPRLELPRDVSFLSARGGIVVDVGAGVGVGVGVGAGAGAAGIGGGG